MPYRKNACCGIVLKLERLCDLETLEMSIPSIRIVPELRSRIRKSAEISEDLPLEESEY